MKTDKAVKAVYMKRRRKCPTLAVALQIQNALLSAPHQCGQTGLTSGILSLDQRKGRGIVSSYRILPKAIEGKQTGELRRSHKETFSQCYWFREKSKETNNSITLIPISCDLKPKGIVPMVFRLIIVFK